MADDFSNVRARMVQQIEAEMRAIGGMLGKTKLASSVVDAVSKVLRHRFLPDDLQNSAYLNRPLSIGFGQTISQPFIVALMTDMLRLKSDARVLEVGTGSGYQTAVLAELVGEVFSVERVVDLAETAEKRLAELGYHNVCVSCADGWDGWPEHAPYDAIIVTAAAAEVPDALVDQIRPGGCLVIPIGTPEVTQFLTLVKKSADGTVTKLEGLPVAFVPLVRAGSSA